MEIYNLIYHGQASISNELVRRASDSPPGKCGPNPCEKPTSPSTFTLPIILGAAVPLVGAAILFLILQRRHTRKIREEDENDLHASLDFGLGDVPKARNESTSKEKEKISLSRRQVSMDMTNNSYLPSFATKNSRASLDSLSLPLRKEDPYRPISRLNSYDAGSMRSFSRDTSRHSGYSNSQPRAYDRPDFTSTGSSSPKPRNPKPVAFPPRVNSLLPYRSSNISITNPSTPSTHPPNFGHLSQAHISANSVMQAPGWANAQPINRQIHSQPQVWRGDINKNLNMTNRIGDNYHMEFIQTNDYNSMNPNNKERKTHYNGASNYAATQSHEYMSTNMNHIQAHYASVPPNYTGNNFEYNKRQNFLTGNRENYFNPNYNDPKMNPKNYPIMGTRPLPPTSVTETDDPEIRANRIRSFYKEYFDENTSVPAGRYERNNVMI